MDLRERENEMKLEKNSRIVFQGDSITDGGRSRNDDLNHVMGHGYAYLIACRLGLDEAHQNYQFFNRGISGNRIVDLYARWQEDTLNLKPDVISILVGVNDIGLEFSAKAGTSNEKYEKVYRLLLEETKEALPEVKFVLCEPFILPVGYVKENWEEWNAAMIYRRRIVRALAQEYHCVFVSLQDEFTNACQNLSPDYWIWDGVHPTPAGHELIARKWLKAVDKF